MSAPLKIPRRPKWAKAFIDLRAEKFLVQPFEHGGLKPIDSIAKTSLYGTVRMKFFKHFASPSWCMARSSNFMALKC